MYNLNCFNNNLNLYGFSSINFKRSLSFLNKKRCLLNSEKTLSDYLKSEASTSFNKTLFL